MRNSVTTEREVRACQIAAGPERAAVLRRRYDAPLADVWAACTEPARLNRWYHEVSGDLRAGGAFQFAFGTHGEIVRCEPPRSLRVTWAHADRLVDEVELRLTADPTGGTILELEHATATRLVEWEGALLDPLPDVGANWELALTHSLNRYLRDELPDAPAAQWFEFTPEVMALAERYTAAWTALVDSAGERA
jgi:uncharacterized protein YndB with AHSA1/START domain